MKTDKRLLMCLWLLLAFAPAGAGANCPQQDPARVAALAQESLATLNAMYAREQALAAGGPSRNLAILAVHLAAEGRLDARLVRHLGQHVETHPNDHFGKLYAGYAWVFSAGEYNRRKNYLRAAEAIKRGFFMIDEAVDSAPDNWRLRYLRMRLDAFVPAELGRYVVALKDASILAETLEELPPEIRPLVPALQAAARVRAGDLEQAQREFDAVRKQYQNAAVAAFSSECALQDVLLEAEISALLMPALEHAQ